MSEQFDEQGNDFETDDVEAPQGRRWTRPDGPPTRPATTSTRPTGPTTTSRATGPLDKAGLEVDDDDVEGHRAAMDKAGWAADKAGLAADEDDVEGHLSQIEVDDDVIGKAGLQVQPPRDADNQGNQF